jgi:uncharacterized protein YprB with RNaseH-like and TPR domain
MSDLRDRLDQIKRAAPATPPAAPRPRLRPATRLDEALPGTAIRFETLTCWRIDTPFDRACPTHGVTPATLPTVFAQLEPATPLDPARTVILDIETTGFSGQQVFLVGVVLPDRDPLTVTQWLARDYPEEPALLHALAAELATRDTWITFNGKSFDEPFLRDRAILHRVPLPPTQRHVDLLHAARRRWKTDLPDCRLATLEQHILRRPRVGDVPSADVPDLFRFFIETGNAGPLRPVVEHNQIDLISCTELLQHLCPTR